MKGDVVTTVRRLVAAAVVAPIVSVFTVFTAASPAAAVARLDAPSRVTSNQTVTLSGTVDHLFDAVLFVDGRQVARGDRKVSYAWRPREHRNGSHRIRLEQKGKVFGAEWHRTSETLVQVAPPVTPGRPAVRLRGGQVILTWRRGPEPDLRRYEITAGRTGKVGSVEVRSACSGRVCGATVAVPVNAAGRRIGFTVRALRGDGAGGTVASGASAATSVTVPAPGGVRQERKAGDSRSPDARSGTIRQKTGDRNSTRSDGGQNGEDENGGEQARVRDLPRLPAREALTIAQGPPETAPGPREPSGTSGTVNDRATASTGQETKRDGTDREGGEGATVPSAPRGDGTTGAAGTGDLVIADNADVAARSPDSADGGMSLYGVVIAGAMVLLLAGAHGGAWVRRRSLTTGAGAADVNDAATSSIAGSSTGDVFGSDRVGSGQVGSDRVGFGQVGSGRAAPGRAVPDRAASGSALPTRAPVGQGASDVPIRPISVRPASLRLAAVRGVPPPPTGTERHQDTKRQANAEQRAGTERHQDTKRQANAEQRGKARREADAEQHREEEGREEPGRQVQGEPPEGRQVQGEPPEGRQAEGQPPEGRQAGFLRVPIRRTGAEQARDAQAKARHAKTGQVRAEQVQSPLVRVRAKRAGMTRDEAMRVETVLTEGARAEHVRVERLPAEQVQAGEHVQAEQVRAGPAPGETVRTRRGRVERGKGERSKERPLRDAPVSPPDTSPEAVSPARAGSAVPAVARMAGRWDGYLPPAPRSMEDSGFWGRPQPGATDFWGDDRHARDE